MGKKRARESQKVSPPWIFTALPTEDSHIFTNVNTADITTLNPGHCVPSLHLEMLLK